MGKETWLWKIPGVGLTLFPLSPFFDLLGRRLVNEQHDASWLRLHAYRCRSVGVTASSKTLRSHMNIPISSLGQASPADFTVPGSLYTCPLGLCRTWQEAVPWRQSHDWGLEHPSLVHQTCPAEPCLPIVPNVPHITNLPVFARFIFLNYSLFFFPGLPMVPECRPLGYLHTRTSWLSKRGFQNPKTSFQNK